MLNRRQFIKASALIPLVGSLPLALFGSAMDTALANTSSLNFFNRGTSLSGEWGADVTLSSGHWTPGQENLERLPLQISKKRLPALSELEASGQKKEALFHDR